MIEEILKGIDKDIGMREDDDDDSGWWETSAGAEFGAGKLKEVLAYVNQLEIKLQIAEDAAARKEKILSALETTAKWKRGLNNGHDNSNNNN